TFWFFRRFRLLLFSTKISGAKTEKCPLPTRLLYSARMMLRVKACVLAMLLTAGSAVSFRPGPSSTPPLAIHLVDVAQRAGITVLNISGEQKKDFLLEVVGNGAAWLDYNNDGLMDLFVVNGSTLEHLKTGGDPIATLYK